VDQRWANLFERPLGGDDEKFLLAGAKRIADGGG
jgi:hypothetical protein